MNNKTTKGEVNFPDRELPYSKNKLTKNTLEVFEETEDLAERVLFKLNNKGEWIQKSRYSFNKKLKKTIKY
jgi:hypothetical protein